jgi:hypothetical protein
MNNSDYGLHMPTMKMIGSQKVNLQYCILKVDSNLENNNLYGQTIPQICLFAKLHLLICIIIFQFLMLILEKIPV